MTTAYRNGALADISVTSVNRSAGLILTDGGETGKIVLWLDADGDETEDSSEAAAAVARIGRGTWLAIDLSQFQPVEVH